MIYVVAMYTDRLNQLIGYRVYDYDSNTFMDVTKDSMVSAIRQGVNIHNVALGANNEVVGTNGDLKNYTKIKCGLVIDRAPLVILKEFPDGSYDVIATQNNVCSKIRMSLPAIEMYNRVCGIANASFMTSKNGTKYLRGIGKEIEKEQTKDINKISSTLRSMFELSDSMYKIDENNDFLLKNKREYNSHGPFEVHLPDQVYQLGAYCFSGTKIKSIVLPKNAKIIGDGCFKDCAELESVKLNNGLETIKRLAFYNAPKLKEIEIPPTVKLIERSCFGNDLKKIVITNRRTILRPLAISKGTKIIYK